MAKRERTVVAVFAPGATIPKGWQQVKGADVAKRKTVTDRRRAEKIVFRWYEQRCSNMRAVFGNDNSEAFRAAYPSTIELVRNAIRLGRSLERAGGKPGKGKGAGK